MDADIQQDGHYCWLFFKHQLKLSTGLLRLHYRNGCNLLLSPNTLISSLATLMSGSDTATRVELAKMLFFTRCAQRMEANRLVAKYCLLNNDNLRANSKAMNVNHFYYSHPTSPITEEFAEKLWNRYSHSTAKELEFANEKANFEAMHSINYDIERACSSQFSPMLTRLEYITLFDRSIQRLLCSTIRFDGLWSKSFNVEYARFHKSNGETINVPYLVKSKTYLYYYDEQSKAKVVQMNFSHSTNLALVLILPDVTISAEHYLHFRLTYQTLKRCFKKLTTRCEVNLSFPKFKLFANWQLARPVQQMGFKECLPVSSRADNDTKKKSDKPFEPVDQNVVLIQKAVIDIGERGDDAGRRLKAVSLFRRTEVNFTADRPFIFALVTTGRARQVQMLGVCEDPTTTASLTIR